MTEYPIVKPKVQIVDYGPKLIDPKTRKIIMTPDQMVALSSGWTYKNTDAFQNLDALKKEEKDLNVAAKKILIQSAGRGHASLSTSIGIWLNIQNSSKMVDSYFTGANFVSALMPSGRRTGINLEQIVIPEKITKAPKRILELYIRASENNIRIYEELVQAGIKQDAAGKIVQYGIAGGGFMFMPLETFVGFERDYELNKDLIPLEIGQVLKQIKSEFPRLGMEMTYAARKNAGRASYPVPTIFKITSSDQINVNDMFYSGESPQIQEIKDICYPDRDRNLSELLRHLYNSMDSPQSVFNFWEKSLEEAKEIIKKHNSSIEVIFSSLVPWRVWGEIKRHRTMPQNPESIYLAIERAKETFDFVREINPKILDSEYHIKSKLETFEKHISIPPEIKKDPVFIKKWLQAFYQSFDAQSEMLKNGIKESDAIQVIPRGLKLGNEKTLDLYNLTLGYLSLRLCGTAEEEMKRMSQQEFKLIQDSDKIPSRIKALVRPKCGYVGFCLEPWAKCKNCMQVQKYVPFEYTEETHGFFESERKKAIDKTLTDL